jgi:hypothetical protein
MSGLRIVDEAPWLHLRPVGGELMRSIMALDPGVREASNGIPAG